MLEKKKLLKKTTDFDAQIILSFMVSRKNILKINLKNILKTNLKILVHIKQISRIGKKEIGKTRRMLIVLKDENEKFKLIGSLSTLRGVNKYRGIKEDFTLERICVKTLPKETKKMNLKNYLDKCGEYEAHPKMGFTSRKLPN